MTFRVFISSSMKDMEIVNELREMLVRYGIEASVPWEIPAGTQVADKISEEIQKSDCVLLIIGKGGGRSANVDFEIGIATALKKLIIPLVEQGSEIPKSLLNREYVSIDRNQPKLSYERAAQYLRSLKVEKEKRNAIGGLLLLGLGLLLLAALTSGD